MAMQKYGGWWDSLNNFLTKFRKPQQPQVPRAPAPTPQGPVSGPQEQGEIGQLIAQAARRNVLLRMRYNGVLRFVEPYSYRTKSTGILLYAFCYKDHGIEAFKPEKIEYAEVTDMPFAPRWPVEIGQD